MSTDSPSNSEYDWQPTASLANLNKRSEILWCLRSYFHQHHLLEVQTPVLGHDTVVDRHINPVQVPGTSLQLAEGANQPYFLQTSPEFGMKRLLAAGMRDIYQISPVFRGGERGRFHNPEFTMVEWYRTGDKLEQAVGFLAGLIQDALKTPTPLIERYETVFQRFAGCNPFECGMQTFSAVAASFNVGVERNLSEDRDAWLDLIFSEVVQPQLGTQQPTIITHYPASQSALARISPSDPRTAERFELFMHGIELANGYHELLDAEEFEERNRLVASQREADGNSALPSHSRLVEAMRAGFPACSGCALGLDRLVMVATNAQAIDQVLAFPIERA